MNFATPFSKILVSLILSIFIVQCNSGDGTTDNRFGTVDTGQCSNDPFDGESPQTKAKTFALTNSGYFNKLMVVDHLDSLLTSSGSDIAIYISTQGVLLYQVSEKTNSECKYFSFLKSASSEAQSNWDKNSNKNSDGETFLLGLFTTYYAPVGDRLYTLREPTIIVRQDTQKWTLLHEFGHFLFASGRVQNPMDPNQTLKRKLELVASDLELAKDTYNDNPTESRALDLNKRWNSFFDLSHELDVRGPLEEFTIESMLIDRLAEDRLTLVSRRNDLANALGYMQSNQQMVQSRYSNLANQIKQFAADFESNGWNQAASNALKISDRIQNVNAFLEQKLIDGINLYNSPVQTSIVSLGLQSFELPQPIIHHHFDLSEVELQDDLYERVLQ